MYSCPGCGASLKFDIREQKMKCSHCNNLYEVNELIPEVQARDQVHRTVQVRDQVRLIAQAQDRVQDLHAAQVLQERAAVADIDFRITTIKD